jgi:hypothetical protein
MWDNIVERSRPQMTIWRMGIACCITTATNTHSENVVLIAFQLQQRMHERASMVRNTFEGSPESIRPFWVSRELVAWPWCNLAASQRRPYCASVGLVSWQWDAVDGACLLYDRRIHNNWASRSTSSRQCPCPFYSSRAGFFGKALHHPGLSASLQPRFGSLRLLAFPIAKIAVEKEYICECDGHTVHTLRQWRLTADWLAPRESDCSGMRSKVSSDWLPSYIRTTRTVFEIFKMAWYFRDRPGICI